jgi:hypothetical protein
MDESWKNYVKQEFMKADSEFVEEMPVGSIDLSTFGLISEATTFVLVRLDDGIHLRPLTSGLNSLRKDMQNSSRPGGSFDMDNAVEALSQFAEEWEETIKKKDKWKKTVKMAEEQEEIMSQETYEEKTSDNSSFLDKIKGIFN